MRRFSQNETNDDNEHTAILKYKRVVLESGGMPAWVSVGDSDLEGEPSYEFAKGFFVGCGLSFEEAIRAAEFVCSNGW